MDFQQLVAFAFCSPQIFHFSRDGYLAPCFTLIYPFSDFIFIPLSLMWILLVIKEGYVGYRLEQSHSFYSGDAD